MIILSSRRYLNIEVFGPLTDTKVRLVGEGGRKCSTFDFRDTTYFMLMFVWKDGVVIGFKASDLFFTLVIGPSSQALF